MKYTGKLAYFCHSVLVKKNVIINVRLVVYKSKAGDVTLYIPI
jgi:hypothetical protein